MPGRRHCYPCPASPPFLSHFSVPPVGTVFTLWKAWRLRNVPFFLLLLPRSRLAESCFHSVGLFPPVWNGNLHSWRFRGESWSFFRLVGSPRFMSLGCRAAWSPWLLPFRALASVAIKAGSYRCRSCSSHPSSALFSSKTLPSWVLTVSSAPDSERRTPSGCSSCSVSIFCLVSFCPRGSLERRLGSLSPVFSPFHFLWSLRHCEVNGWGAGFGLPIRLFLFQLWGCPSSAVAVAGVRCSVWRAPSVLRDGLLVPVLDPSLSLLRSPVSFWRSGCACLGLRPCGKCLRLCLRKVP